MESSSLEPNSFWRTDFTTRNLMASKLRVYYALSDGDRWQASPSPRYEFAAEPMLYKIQLATQVAPGIDVDQQDAGLEFLEDLTATDW